MHITFKNTLNANVKITVQPSYRILSGGKHGSGFSSLMNVELKKRSTRAWLADIGKPKGVNVGQKISKCIPSLFLIELAD